MWHIEQRINAEQKHSRFDLAKKQKKKTGALPASGEKEVMYIKDVGQSHQREHFVSFFYAPKACRLQIFIILHVSASENGGIYEGVHSNTTTKLNIK